MPRIGFRTSHPDGVVFAAIDRMSDEDPEMLAALQALRSRTRAVQGEQARVLERAIERVLATFYRAPSHGRPGC